MWLVCIVLWMLEDSLTSTTLRFEARECLQPGETCDNLLLFTRQGWTSKRLMQAAQADQSRDRKWLFGAKVLFLEIFGESPLKLSRYIFWKICWNLFGLLLGDSTNGFWQKNKKRIFHGILSGKGPPNCQNAFTSHSFALIIWYTPFLVWGPGHVFPCSAWWKPSYRFSSSNLWSTGRKPKQAVGHAPCHVPKLKGGSLVWKIGTFLGGTFGEDYRRVGR